MIPILQMMKLGHRELSKDHVASQWQNLNANLCFVSVYPKYYIALVTIKASYP